MWWHQRSAVKTIVDTGLPIRHLISGSSSSSPKLLPRDVPYVFERLGKGFQLATTPSTSNNNITTPKGVTNVSVLQSLCTDYAAAQRRDTSYTVDVPILVPPRGLSRLEPYTYSVPDTPEYFIQHHLLAPPPQYSNNINPFNPDAERQPATQPSPPSPMSAALQLMASHLEKEALAIARLDALATGRTITEALVAVHKGIATLTHTPPSANTPTTTTTSSIVIVSPLYNPTEVFIRCLGDALRGWASTTNQKGGGGLCKILWLPSSQATLSTSLITSCVLSVLEEVGVLEGGTQTPPSSTTSIRFTVAHFVDRRGVMQRAANIVSYTDEGGFVCVGEMDPEPQGGRVTDISSLFTPTTPPTNTTTLLSTNILSLVQLCRGLRRDTDVLVYDNANTANTMVDYKELYALADSISDCLLGVGTSPSSSSPSSLLALCNTPCSGAVSFINGDSSPNPQSNNASSSRVSRYIVDKYYSISSNGADPYLRPRYVYIPEEMLMDVVSSLGPLLIQNEDTQQQQQPNNNTTATNNNSSVFVGHVLDDDACIGPVPSSSVLHATETAIDYALNCVSMDVTSYRGSMARLASSKEDKKRAVTASEDEVLDWALARNLVPALQHNYALHSKCRLVVGGFSLSYTSGCFYAPTLLYAEDDRLLKTLSGGDEGGDEVVASGGRKSYYSSFSQTPSHELYLDSACVRSLPTMHPVFTSHAMRAPVVVLCPYKDQQPQRGIQSTASTQQVLRAHHAASQRAPFVCYAKRLITSILGGGGGQIQDASRTPYSKANLSETKAAVLIGDRMWKRHCRRIFEGRGGGDGVAGENGTATGFDVQFL